MRRDSDTLSFAADGLSLNGALNISSEEMHTTIERALANDTLAQEKATWLRQGLEKGFMTDGRFIYLPVAQKTVKSTIYKKLTDGLIAILSGAKGLMEVNKSWRDAFPAT